MWWMISQGVSHGSVLILLVQLLFTTLEIIMIQYPELTLLYRGCTYWWSEMDALEKFGHFSSFIQRLALAFRVVDWFFDSGSSHGSTLFKQNMWATLIKRIRTCAVNTPLLRTKKYDFRKEERSFVALHDFGIISVKQVSREVFM